MKIHLTKCIASAIDTDKNAKLVLCGMDPVDVVNCFVKSLAISFFINKHFGMSSEPSCQYLKYCCITGIMNMAMEGKIVIFKTLVLPKIIHLSSLECL